MSKLKCKFCDGKEYVKAGRIFNRAGVWQKYLCKRCGHTFKGELLQQLL